MKPKEVSLASRIWNRIKHPFTTPAHLIIFQHLTSEKDQITANVYAKSVEDVHKIGDELRKLFKASDDEFQKALELTKAKIEAELAAKNKNSKQGNK